MAREPVTPFDVAAQAGATRLLRLGRGPRRAGLPPIVLVPSLLQRWYILDLHPAASLVRELVAAELDVFVVDWGELGSERHLSWDDALKRLGQFVRRAARLAQVQQAALVGYSQGATLAAIAAALAPERVGALVAIAGPIDFAERGALGPLTDARWVSADALADAGGAPAGAFRALVAALHPGATALSLWNAAAHPDPPTRALFAALEAWAADTVPLPPEILRVWLGRLYQDNALVARRLRVAGRLVDLAAIRAPTLVVTAERDTICPAASSLALLNHVTAAPTTHWGIPGGHVSGIAGPGSRETLHVPLATWLGETLADPLRKPPSATLLQ